MARVVLVVEDSEQCAVTLEIALASNGLAVRRFANGRDALAYLDSEGHCVCAVLTDLHMPAMDGFELIRHIRGNPRFARLPILVLSADSDPRTPERIVQYGANGFFPKPFSPAKVRTRLEQLVNEMANSPQR